jgi:MFS superfamily sulfate permease-like transporter
MALRRAAPAVPASLVVVALAVVAVDLFDLDHHGVAIVGHIDRGLPSVSVPHPHSASWGDLIGPALGVMLVGFAEGLGAAKTYAAKAHEEVDANRELLGLGAANLGAGLCSGMVVNGSLSKTAVNGAAGARSQVSSLVAAAFTILTLLLLTGLFENLPEATLAAIVIVAVAELVDVPALGGLYRVATGSRRRVVDVAARPDFVGAVAALLGVLIFDTLPGLVLGIAISLLLLLYRASRPRVVALGQVPGTDDQFGDVQRHPENTPPEHVVVLRVESGLFFANAEFVRGRILAAVGPDTRGIVLDAEDMPFIDVTAADMLERLAGDLERRGVRLVLARDVGPIRDVLRETGDRRVLLGVHPSVTQAVDAVTDGGAPVRSAVGEAAVGQAARGDQA